MTAKEAARKIGVTEQTYYRWRKEYGGMQISQAKRLKALEKENIRLKRLVAEKELDPAFPISNPSNAFIICHNILYYN